MKRINEGFEEEELFNEIDRVLMLNEISRVLVYAFVDESEKIFLKMDSLEAYKNANLKTFSIEQVQS